MENKWTFVGVLNMVFTDEVTYIQGGMIVATPIGVLMKIYMESSKLICNIYFREPVMYYKWLFIRYFIFENRLIGDLD